MPAFTPNTREKRRSRMHMRKSVIRTCMRQSALIPTKVGCEHFHRDSLEKLIAKNAHEKHKIDQHLVHISVGTHYDENHHPEPLVHWTNEKMHTIVFDFDRTITCDHVYKATGGKAAGECIKEYSDETIVHWFGGQDRMGSLSELLATVADEEIKIVILSHGFRATILEVLKRVLAMDIDENTKEGFRLVEEVNVFGREELMKMSEGDKGTWIEDYMEKEKLTFNQLMFIDDDESNVLPIMQDNTCMTTLVGGGGLSLDEMDEIQKLAVNPDYEPPMVAW